MVLKTSAQKVTYFTSTENLLAKQITWPRLISPECGNRILLKESKPDVRRVGKYNPPPRGGTLYLGIKTQSTVPQSLQPQRLKNGHVVG